MQGTLARDESGNNNDAMLINGAEIVYEGGKCDSGVSLLGKLNFISFHFCPGRNLEGDCSSEKCFIPISPVRQGRIGQRVTIYFHDPCVSIS